MTATTVCWCSHEVFMHHFNRYLGFEGEDGHGKCASTGCACESFGGLPPNQRPPK